MHGRLSRGRPLALGRVLRSHPASVGAGSARPCFRTLRGAVSACAPRAPPGPAWAWAVVSVSAAQSGAGPGRAPRERSRQQPLPGPSPAPASATVCPPGLLLVIPWPESWGASTARAPVGPAAGPVRSSPRPVLRAPNPACRVALCGGSGSRHGCPARARSPLRLDGMGTPVTLRVARRFPRGVHGVLLLASVSVPEAPRA